MTRTALTGRLMTVAACVALTACGSTVQLSGQTGAGGDQGLGAPLAGAPTGGELAAGGGASGTSGGVPVARPTGGGAAVPAGGRTVGAGSTGAGATPGRSSAPVGGKAFTGPATGSPVEVGIVLYPDVSEAAAALGGSGESTGDQKQQFDTSLAWLNAHGGLAGHAVKPVYYNVQLTDTRPYSQTYQEACTTFTGDHKAVAAIVIGNVEPALPQCLAKGGAMMLGSGDYLRDQTDHAALPSLVAPSDVASDRVVRVLVEQVLAQGKVKRGDKLGLVHMDYSGPRKGRDLMTSLLKAEGVTVVPFEIPYPQSTPAITQSAAAVQSAQLRMASEGIKTVAFLCPGCVGFFQDYAESQNYYPDYVLSSWDGIAGSNGGGHTRSNDGAVVVGWDPMRDVGGHSHPRDVAGNATRAACKPVVGRFVTQDTQDYAAYMLCGMLMDLRAAAAANPQDTITLQGLVQGFGSLGTSQNSVANFDTELTPQRRDGTASYRVMRYDATRDEFSYASTTRQRFR